MSHSVDNACVKTGLIFLFNGKKFTGDLFYYWVRGCFVIKGIPSANGVPHECPSDIYHIEVFDADEIDRRGNYLDVVINEAAYTDVFLEFVKKWNPESIVHFMEQDWNPIVQPTPQEPT